MQQTSVIIVGAGPTGLMAACQLQRLGIAYRIIDKKEGPTKESRALVVHARSLEIYEQMGLAQKALDQGQIIEKIQFSVKGKKVVQMPLGVVGKGLTAFPFLLVLEQSRNEALLYEYLQQQGGKVDWQTELTSLQQTESAVRVTIKNKEGEEMIKAAWLIAADGGRSEVRHQLQIPFEGKTYEHIFYVADTGINQPREQGTVSLQLSENAFLGFFPMKGTGRFRLLGILPPQFENAQPKTFEALVPAIQQQFTQPISFHDTSWFSIYHVHHRCMKNFRSGRVFFAGDAAHIHSPVGGQGMNTGLQDAYNLAWKIGYVIKGWASQNLLDSYNEERLPFAQQLVASTDRAFTVVTSNKWWAKFARLQLAPLILPLLLKQKELRLRGFITVSQIGIKYPSSGLTAQDAAHALSIKAGERFPYLLLENGKSGHSFLKELFFYAVFFALENEASFVQELEAIKGQHQGVLKLLDWSREEKIKQQLGVKKSTIILVRPDQYIGLITDKGTKAVDEYLQQLQA